jgi:hypothetical protein
MSGDAWTVRVAVTDANRTTGKSDATLVSSLHSFAIKRFGKEIGGIVCAREPEPASTSDASEAALAARHTDCTAAREQRATNEVAIVLKKPAEWTKEHNMSNSSTYGVDLLPIPSDSPAAAIGGAALFAGVFLLFMGFNEYSSGSITRVTALERDADIDRLMTKAMDGGIRKIGLGIVAVLVGVGIAATRQTSSSKKDEHAS